jgi:hypothetical protein
VARSPTPFEQQLADHYNSCTPKEQRGLDLKLQQLRAKAVASPQAIFHLFPCLGTKTLKTKEPT